MAKEVSKNERAKVVMGLRDLGMGWAAVIDMPCELGYHCPVCKYELITDGNYDERLSWSEYNSFIWCEICNRDYPSCLCLPDDPIRAIDIFLDSVKDAI